MAWEEAGVLHGDVSCANILIDVDSPDPKMGKNEQPQATGFLNDWDMCLYKEEVEKAIPANRSVCLLVLWPSHDQLTIETGNLGIHVLPSA